MHDTEPGPNGRHLIAGRWTDSASRFFNAPLSGAPRAFAKGTPDLVDRAARAAEDAFASYATTSRDLQAQFLERIAEEIDARGDAITTIGHAETGLLQARLLGERRRTTGQLRFFAQHLRQGSFLDTCHDPALPDRAPLPRPDLRLIQGPVGPVAVFGASNFPLAFSTAGATRPRPLRPVAPSS